MSIKELRLIVKYLTRQASLSELDELSEKMWDPYTREEFKNYAKINFIIDHNIKKFNTPKSREQLLAFIGREKKASGLRRTVRIIKYAAILLLFSGGSYYLYNGFLEKTPGSSAITTVEVNHIKPGSDKAILTLQDGSHLDLAEENITTAALKNNGKTLSYNDGYADDASPAYNHITIPRGGQFQIKLSDGTRVWLNSETKLKYPVAFVKGETRSVELLYGEAYFDVAPASRHTGTKFRVVHQSQEIEVLGTEFNIRAYRDESHIATTLVEGKVAISAGDIDCILKPNEKASLNLQDHKMDISITDVSDEISWKKGVFSFTGMSLETIAKVLDRWYDVQIIFTNPELRKVKFNGMISKKENIEEILNLIVSTNSINAYEIKNKHVYIK
ncbi:FecR family protein [Sinomicrobium sp. M5D2P17]